MIKIPFDCPRGRKDCIALSNIVSDDGSSFFCCGENDGANRIVKQDNFNVCFKGEFRDELSQYDKRDIAHHASVLVQALAIVEKAHGEDGDEQDFSPWRDE